MKAHLKRGLAALNVQIGRRPHGIAVMRGKPGVAPLDRESLNGALRNLKQAGFSPTVVIDVGAAYGTGALMQFPDAHHLMVEPLEEFHAALQHLQSRVASSEIFIGLAGTEEGEATLNVHPDLVGSSVYLEAEQSGVNGTPRTVPVRRLDDMVLGRPGPYLLKVDTQGAELQVLAGATEVLERTEVVVLEVSFIRFFEGGPIAHEVIAYMAERGFVLYDIVDVQHRPLDLALSQVDAIFVSENTTLRRDTSYATREQRDAQDRDLRRENRRHLRTSRARG